MHKRASQAGAGGTGFRRYIGKRDMRIATFNLESLDAPVGRRAEVLRPALERLAADILCLQEVNAQHVPQQRQRSFLALDTLLEGTPYAEFQRAWSTAAPGGRIADVHNLVTLSRFPIRRQRQIWHSFMPPAQLHLVTGAVTDKPVEIHFDRPMLLCEIELGGSVLHLVNLHLRATLAAPIPGQKISPFAWKSVGAWAEGYYLSGLKRTGQALELRLLLDQLLDDDPHALIAVAGDFNAEDHETPMRIIMGTSEDTGNAALAGQAMVALERAIEPGRRFSVIHHGRPQMLDHILASHGLYGRFHAIEVHNEALGDEALGYAKGVEPAGSYHAAMVADFAE